MAYPKVAIGYPTDDLAGYNEGQEKKLYRGFNF